MALIKKKSSNYDIGSAVKNLSDNVSKSVQNTKTNISNSVQATKNTISNAASNATTAYENFADKTAANIPGYTLLGSALKSSANTRAYQSDQNKADTNLEQLESSRPEYADSEDLTTAKSDLANIESQKDNVSAKYDDRIQAALDNIEKYSEFNYDVESDPLWNSIKSQYQRNATLGMKETLGATANLTGGYASSYSQQAAQQSYQNAIAEMTDIIPELESNALSRFQSNQSAALSNFSALENAYQNELSEWQNNRDYYYNKVANMSEEEWNKYIDNLSAWQTDRNYWTDYRNQAIQNQQWQAELDEEKAQFRQQMLYNYVNMGVSAATDLATTGMSVGGSLASTGINAGVDLAGLGLDLYQYKNNLAEEQRQFDANLAEEQRQFNVKNSGTTTTAKSSSSSSKSSGSSSSGKSSSSKSSSSGTATKTAAAKKSTSTASKSSSSSSKSTSSSSVAGPLVPGNDNQATIKNAYSAGQLTDEQYKKLMKAAKQ